ncbi:hypothetical protein H7H98_10495 [Mycolicibacterium sphagni]|nr:hypothetical protein [Mycolicibacterium sphagni]
MFSVVGLVLTGGIVLGAVQLGRHLSTTTQSQSGTPQKSSYSAVPGAQTATPATSLPSNTAPDSAILTTDFVSLAKTLNAQVGIAIAPAGRPDAEPILLGPWRNGPAWSTIKVPLIIAGHRAVEPPTITGAMSAAITQSDNDAAESVWQSLGPPAAAATQVQAVLAETGDPTVVQSEKIRPQFSAFGQTEWSLTNQLRFLSAAVCDTRNDAVFNLMGQISADQSWGLGQISGARYKGGWGPSLSGAYLVRQIGVISTDRGLVVVAAATEPQSGSFTDGTADLNRIAAWLQAHTNVLPAGTCPASDPEGHH